MSADPINDFSPEVAGMTQGAKRPWGTINAHGLSDGVGNVVDMAALIKFYDDYIYGGGAVHRYDYLGPDTPSNTWTIQHNLNNRRPFVVVFDSAGNEVVCIKDYPNATESTIRVFNAPDTGTAVLYG